MVNSQVFACTKLRQRPRSCRAAMEGVSNQTGPTSPRVLDGLQNDLCPWLQIVGIAQSPLERMVGPISLSRVKAPTQEAENGPQGCVTGDQADPGGRCLAIANRSRNMTKGVLLACGETPRETRRTSILERSVHPLGRQIQDTSGLSYDGRTPTPETRFTIKKWDRWGTQCPRFRGLRTSSKFRSLRPKRPGRE